MKPKLLAMIGFAAILVFISAYIIGTVQNHSTGYDHLRNSILAIDNPSIKYHFLVSVPLSAFYNALIFIGIGLLIFFPKIKKPTLQIGATLLILAGLIGSVLVFIFPADQTNSVPSNMGFYHLLLYSIFTVVITISIFLIGLGFAGYKNFVRYKTPSLIIAFVIIASDALAKTAWVQRLEIMGLFNRIGFFCILTWIFIVSRQLFRTRRIEPL